MNVWLVTIGEPLPIGDTGNRLLRAGLLAEALLQRGHNVTWWSSTFDHFQRKHWFQSDKEIQIQPNLKLKLLHGVGYSKNMSLQRMFDHAQIAWKFRKQARRESPPDVIHCSMPPIELALAVANFGKARKIPTVLDMRDMWPDIFLELFPKSIQPCFKILLFPWFYMLRKACCRATAIIGMTPFFVDWGLSYAGRVKRTWDRDFPFGYPEKVPSPEALQEAEYFWDRHGVLADRKEFVICFFGAIGWHFGGDCFFSASKQLEQSGRGVKFVFCGIGDALESYRAQGKGNPNLLFPGWVDQAKIWTLMRRSKAGLAHYRKSKNLEGNLTNKPIEYLSAGLPILTNVSGYLQGLLEQHGCGLFYPENQPDDLFSRISLLYDNPGFRDQMSNNASRLFQERFSAKKVYREISEYLERLALENPLTK